VIEWAGAEMMQSHVQIASEKLIIQNMCPVCACVPNCVHFSRLPVACAPHSLPAISTPTEPIAPRCRPGVSLRQGLAPGTATSTERVVAYIGVLVWAWLMSAHGSSMCVCACAGGASEATKAADALGNQLPVWMQGLMQPEGQQLLDQLRQQQQQQQLWNQEQQHYHQMASGASALAAPTQHRRKKFVPSRAAV